MSARDAVTDGLSHGIGRAVAMRRVERGITQVELAGELGVTVARLAAWETGRNAMSVGWAVRVAGALAIDVDTLSKRAERLSNDG